jgi:hypothetical protein
MLSPNAIYLFEQNVDKIITKIFDCIQDATCTIIITFVLVILFYCFEFILFYEEKIW